MNKEVFVFIFDGYADWEPSYACTRINDTGTGYTVKTVALTLEPVTSMGGFRVLPDYSIENCPMEFSLLLLPGGAAWTQDKNNDVLPLVDYAVKHQIPVAAICNGVVFLAEKGYLDTVKHSGNTLPYIKKCAPHYAGDAYFLKKPAVCDGGIITANGCASLEFAKEIMLLLKTNPEEEILEWYEFHKKGIYQP